MIVDESKMYKYAESTKQQVESTFRRFLKDSNISVILLTQDVSEKYVKTLMAERT